MISLIGVTEKLTPVKTFPQRRAITDSLNKLMVHQWKGVRIAYIRILRLTDIYKHR